MDSALLTAYVESTCYDMLTEQKPWKPSQRDFTQRSCESSNSTNLWQEEKEYNRDSHGKIYLRFSKSFSVTKDLNT
jgi:hypothetical protein